MSCSSKHEKKQAHEMSTLLRFGQYLWKNAIVGSDIEMQMGQVILTRLSHHGRIMDGVGGRKVVLAVGVCAGLHCDRRSNCRCRLCSNRGGRARGQGRAAVRRARLLRCQRGNALGQAPCNGRDRWRGRCARSWSAGPGTAVA